MKVREFFGDVDGVSASMLDHAIDIWQLLAEIETSLADLLKGKRRIGGSVSAAAYVADGPMYVAPTATIEPGAVVMASSYIGDNVVIRSGAYVRESCIFCEDSLLGHASEAKNSLFLRGAKAPHFAYVGDSVLGADVNLGAGTKLSNVKISRVRGETFSVVVDGESVETGLSKFGAIIGDGAQVGCNAVLNPGTVVGPESMVYPGAVVSGYLPRRTIAKLRQDLILSPRI